MREKIRLCWFCMALILSLTACSQPTADKQDTKQPNSTDISNHADISTPEPPAEPEPEPEPEPRIPFADVPEDASYYDMVVWAYENGIVSDGSIFEPDSACTRGQVVTFLWRAVGSPEPQTTENPFSDISSSDWYYSPALWAYENGIAAGTAFNPGNPCTNGEVVTFLWRAEGKPIAAIYSSPISQAASDSYYARPVAWGESNGMFSGLDFAFDPTAPCSRANMVTFLYWCTEQWTLSEEDKTIQAEYEQIINGAQLYEVHGSGLIYADYVDIDGDGKVELLTVGTGEDEYEAIVSMYANIDGHVKKSCEGIVEQSLGNSGDNVFLCKLDGHLYLYLDGLLVWSAGAYSTNIYQIYKIEKEAVTIAYDLSHSAEYIFEMDTFEDTYTASEKEITEEEFNSILQKFTDIKHLYSYSSDWNGDGNIVISDRGVLPSRDEYNASMFEYWGANREQIYAAVLAGDFSYFAGSYTDERGYRTEILYENGIFTGIRGRYEGQKPISVTKTDNGMIKCVVETLERKIYFEEGYGEVDTTVGAEYVICPVGVEFDMEYYLDGESISDTSTVRLVFIEGAGSAGIDTYVYIL